MTREPRYESRNDAKRDLKDAESELKEYLATLLETEPGVVDDDAMSRVAQVAARKAAPYLEAKTVLESGRTEHDPPGTGRPTEHRRERKLRQGLRFIDEVVVHWVVLPREGWDEVGGMPDREVIEAARDQTGWRFREERSRGPGDSFARAPSVRRSRSRVLVTWQIGLDI